MSPFARYGLRVAGCESFDWGFGIADFGFDRVMWRDPQPFAYFNLLLLHSLQSKIPNQEFSLLTSEI
jgi:hypothetical protein